MLYLHRLINGEIGFETGSARLANDRDRDGYDDCDVDVMDVDDIDVGMDVGMDVHVDVSVNRYRDVDRNIMVEDDVINVMCVQFNPIKQSID